MEFLMFEFDQFKTVNNDDLSPTLLIAMFS